MIFEEKQRSQPIRRHQVWEAFQKVRRNKGSSGVDEMSISEVSLHARKYLYPVWNRMSRGSYFASPVLEVEIPKGDGRMRKLGIPTVLDRVAQQVIKTELETLVDSRFSENSYGYRPNKSAYEALSKCRENCMRMDWVIDLDIKNFFDEIDHELLMKSLSYFTDRRHIHLYVKRWLKAPMRCKDGELRKRDRGTPQGGVISPLLANIFLHVVFDKWIEHNYPEVKFERYADDIIVHCRNFKEALRLLEAIKLRFRKCKLRIKDGKSNIVYCKRNQKRHPPFKVHYVSFTFLGFTFRPRMVKGSFGHYHLGFTPSISRKNQKRMTHALLKMRIHRMVHLNLTEIANILSPILRGWINYYGKFRKSSLYYLFRFINRRLGKWVRNKYRRFRNKHWFVAYKWLQATSKKYPNLFEHWKHGFTP